MITKIELKNNLNKSIKKISSLIIGTSSDLDMIDIGVIDFDYDPSNHELVMVLIEVKLNVYSEHMFDDFIKTCEFVSDTFNDIFSKFSFDNNGNLKPPKSINSIGGVIFNGGILISSIEFSHRLDEVKFEINCMFS